MILAEISRLIERKQAWKKLLPQSRKTPNSKNSEPLKTPSPHKKTSATLDTPLDAPPTVFLLRVIVARPATSDLDVHFIRLIRFYRVQSLGSRSSQQVRASPSPC